MLLVYPNIHFIELSRSDIYFERNISGIFNAINGYRPQKIRVFGRAGGGVKLVVSDALIEEQLKTFLIEYDITTAIIDDKKLDGDRKKKNRLISDFILEKLTEYDIDYCFSFGSHILSGELLKSYENKLINFHPAILPMFPGRKSIDQAEEHGNILLVGNTAHFIDSGMDTGPIIMQSVIPLKSFSDTNDYNIVLDLQIEMLNKLLNILESNRLHFVKGMPFIDGADYNKSMIFPCL